MSVEVFRIVLFFVAAFVAVDVEAAAKKDVVTKQGTIQLDCTFSGFPGFSRIWTRAGATTFSAIQSLTPVPLV